MPDSKKASIPNPCRNRHTAIVGDISYKTLGEKTGIHEKSLNRMFGPKGNPTLSNALKVLTSISDYEGIKLKVVAEKA